MKQEINKYLESQTKLNEQTIRMRKMGMILSMSLIILALASLIIATILI